MEGRGGAGGAEIDVSVEECGRSFGKGLIQGAFPLSDGSGLMLTIAKYFTPDFHDIQVRRRRCSGGRGEVGGEKK
eukprot:71987-Hanusia_phi.AAC.1